MHEYGSVNAVKKDKGVYYETQILSSGKQLVEKTPIRLEGSLEVKVDENYGVYGKIKSIVLFEKGFTITTDQGKLIVITYES